MNADSAFQIGSTHAVCQDYAAAGLCARGRPYAALSDGCSSSPDTDFGARLLVRAAARLLGELEGTRTRDIAGLHREAARLALSWAEGLGLPPQAADATLLTAHLDGEELIVGCSGDGVVCLQSRSGAFETYEVSFPSGYPLYPAYAHQPGRLRSLEREGRDAKEVTRHPPSTNGERPRSGGESLTEVFTFRAADFKYVALFSDGVRSFTHEGRAGEEIPLDSVLPELLSFKSPGGAFVGRRMKMFLKDCRRKGWRHADDLSLAALHLGG